MNHSYMMKEGAHQAAHISLLKGAAKPEQTASEGLDCGIFSVFLLLHPLLIEVHFNL